MSIAGLDRWLTTDPNSGYDDWWSYLFDEFTPEFFQNNEEWLTNEEGLCDQWASKLYEHEYSPKSAAAIIERAFSIFYRQWKK